MADAEVPREEIHEPEPARAIPSDEVLASIVERFPDAVAVDSHGQAVVYISRDSWHDLAQFLRDDERFTQCLDVTVVDHLVDSQRLTVAGVEPERFEVVASFLSHPRNRRVRAICEVPEDDPQVASIVDVFAGVDFGEREAFDMYGVTFVGHPDLTRILMPDDWVGFPLRKDDAPGRVPVAFKGDPNPR